MLTTREIAAVAIDCPTVDLNVVCRLPFHATPSRASLGILPSQIKKAGSAAVKRCQSRPCALALPRKL